MHRNSLDDWTDLTISAKNEDDILIEKIFLINEIFDQLAGKEIDAAMYTKFLLFIAQKNENLLHKNLSTIDVIIHDDKFWKDKSKWKINGIEEMKKIRKSKIGGEMQWQRIKEIAGRPEKKSWLFENSLFEDKRHFMTQRFYDYTLRDRPEDFISDMTKDFFSIADILNEDILLTIIVLSNNKDTINFLLTSKFLSSLLNMKLFTKVLHIDIEQITWIKSHKTETQVNEYYKWKWFNTLNISINLKDKKRPLSACEYVKTDKIDLKNVGTKKLDLLISEDRHIELLSEASRLESFIPYLNKNTSEGFVEYFNKTLTVKEEFTSGDALFILSLMPDIIKANAYKCFEMFMKIYYLLKIDAHNGKYTNFPSFKKIIFDTNDSWFIFKFIELTFKYSTNTNLIMDLFEPMENEQDIALLLNNLSDDVYSKILGNKQLAMNIYPYSSSTFFRSSCEYGRACDAYSGFHENMMVKIKKNDLSSAQMKKSRMTDNELFDELLKAKITMEELEQSQPKLAGSSFS